MFHMKQWNTFTFIIGSLANMCVVIRNNGKISQCGRISVSLCGHVSI